MLARNVLLALLALQLPAMHAFDFDEEEVPDSPAGDSFSGGSDLGEGIQVPVTETLGAGKPRVRGHLYVRSAALGTGSRRVTLRTSQFKLDADGIDELKAAAKRGDWVTLSIVCVQVLSTAKLRCAGIPARVLSG